MTDKQFIAVKLPVATVEALEAFAKAHDMSRSKAMRFAFTQLLDVDPDDEFQTT